MTFIYKKCLGCNKIRCNFYVYKFKLFQSKLIFIFHVLSTKKSNGIFTAYLERFSKALL